MFRKFDEWITSWAPTWFIYLLASAIAAFLVTAGFTGIIAFATLDATWLVGKLARGMFAGFTALCFVVLSTS